MWTDQHAVSARSVDLLDHELVEALHNVFQRRGLPATIGRHIFEQRLLGKIEPYEVRYVAVNRLVVGDSGADCICHRHVAGQIGANESRHAQNRGRIEDQGIEKIIVDPPIDHIHPARAERGAHEHLIVVDEQIATLDQLDPELIGEERVLIVG